MHDQWPTPPGVACAACVGLTFVDGKKILALTSGNSCLDLDADDEGTDRA